MPTLGQIKKSAKEQGFCEDMEALGFTLGSAEFWFYRRRGEFLDIVDIWPNSSGNWLEFPVQTVVDEMIDDYDMSNFPKGFLKVLRHGTDLFITKEGVDHPLHAWEATSEEKLQETLTTVSKLMSTKADTWFKNIDSRAKLYESISSSVKDGSSGPKLKKLLL